MPPSPLHVVYRYTSTDNGKSRPAWFTKSTAFASCVRAARLAENVTLDIMVDGETPEKSVSVLGKFGEVHLRRKLGNSGSYRAVIEWVVSHPSWSAHDVVYLCEDDYLHAPDAFVRLRGVVDRIRSVEYYSLYEHPNAYRTVAAGSDSDGREHMYCVDGHHWRTIRSTCMTFATKIETLGRDVSVP